MLAKKGWNIISRSYQEKTRISLEDVHYGPISYGERKLKLLGDVKGKDVLEIGCGGGQNAVVLAKWGARSVGLDNSEEQIKYAQKLAMREKVKIPFHVGNMEDLSLFSNESFDVVLSSFAVGYVENLTRTFQDVFIALRKNGLFVFAEVHPMVDRGRIVRCGKRKMWMVSNYFDRSRRIWTWKINGKVARFCGFHRTMQDYFDLLIAAGFVVERILEPKPFAVDKMSEAERKRVSYIEEGFVKDYEVWKKIPYTMIFKARKP